MSRTDDYDAVFINYFSLYGVANENYKFIIA